MTLTCHAAIRVPGRGARRLAARAAIRIIACALLLMVLSGLATPAAAQNLVVNPGFHDNLDDWQTFGFVTHDPGEDADGSPVSGSARFQADLPDDSPFSAAFQQCVDGIVAGATYEFGGQILLTARPDGAFAHIVLSWQTGDCATGSFLPPISDTSDVSVVGTWQTVGGSAVAPPGAASAYIGGGVFLLDGEYDVHFDNLSLQQTSGPTPVPTMGAVSLAILALLVTMAALRLRPFHGRTA